VWTAHQDDGFLDDDGGGSHLFVLLLFHFGDATFTVQQIVRFAQRVGSILEQVLLANIKKEKGSGPKG
jgi:hypothetical protein